MPTNFTVPMTYFLQEGKENLGECLKISFEAAARHNISRIVIFTAKGDGVRLAINDFCSKPEFKDISLVAVTFPFGKRFTDAEGKELKLEISEEDIRLFTKTSVPIVRAHLPFDPILSPFRERGALGQDLSLIGNALSIFGGSMSLCVQATTMACDAGAVDPGEHCIALTSDTSILVRATPTSHLLTDFIVREILCKPAILTIGRGEPKRVIADTQPENQPVVLPAPEADRKKLT